MSTPACPPNPPLNSFGGLIIQTVIQADDPQFYPGQVFTGYYQYDSVSADGTFHLANSISSAANRSLKGLIYLPYAPLLGSSRARLNALPDTVNDGYLVVTGGVVTEFSWGIDVGGFFSSFSVSSFLSRAYDHIDPTTGNPIPQSDTKGTVYISPPVGQ